MIFIDLQPIFRNTHKTVQAGSGSVIRDYWSAGPDPKEYLLIHNTGQHNTVFNFVWDRVKRDKIRMQLENKAKKYNFTLKRTFIFLKQVKFSTFCVEIWDLQVVTYSD